MPLLLDENASGRAFARALAARGRDVALSSTLVGYGAADARVLEAAVASERVVVTRDCDDFRRLAAERPDHPGIFSIVPTRLTALQLATAVDHVAATVSGLTRHLLALHESGGDARPRSAVRWDAHALRPVADREHRCPALGPPLRRVGVRSVRRADAGLGAELARGGLRHRKPLRRRGR